MPARTAPPRPRRLIAGTCVAALTCAALVACTAAPADEGDGSQRDDESSAGTKNAAAQDDGPEMTVVSNIASDARSVPVDQTLRLSVRKGTLRAVNVTSRGRALAGEMGKDGTWKASDRLEPGQRYAVRTVAVDDEGDRQTSSRRFSTADLTLDEQTFPSVAPLADETVGVGMPAIVTFDVPVTDRKSIEKHLEVTSSPQQAGAWHWMSDQEVHWRPKTYWQPGTEVTVEADINSVPAGNGVYGQESRTIAFDVGDSVVSKVNAQTHQMKTYVNGDLARTIPITTGKPGFTTRSGVKVIIEKFREKRMNSETVGIDRGDPEAYDIADVEYAMRVTYSGEFLHAAPWSVGSQGSANVSHGCTGMSTADAGWLYDITKRGDVVEYTGTDRPMTVENGYGDWNLSYDDYAAGSALS